MSKQLYSGFLSVAILLLLSGSAIGQQAGWNHLDYDGAGSSFQPVGSTHIPASAFVPTWTVSAAAPQVLTGDVTGDGQLELVTADTDTIKVYSCDGELIQSFAPDLGSTSQLCLGVLEDYDGDGVLDIGVGTIGGGDLRSHVYAGDGTLLQSFSYTEGGNDSAMIPRTITDDNVIVSFDSGFARYPRGAASYDKSSGVLLWQYKVGPAGGTTSIVQEDGGQMIALGARTVHNGAVGDGWNGNGTRTTDGDMYAISVSGDGSEVFTEGFTADGESDGCIYTHFIDLNGDGSSEYVAFEGHFRDIYQGTSQIHQLDVESGDILKTFDGPSGHNWEGRIFGDLDGDGSTEILATAAQSTGYNAGYYSFFQYVLDEDLNEVSSSSLSGHIRAAGDLDGDGIAEVFITYGDMLRVTDLEFNESWNWKAGGTIDDVVLSDIDSDGIMDILVHDNTGSVTVLQAVPEPGDDESAGDEQRGDVE